MTAVARNGQVTISASLLKLGSFIAASIVLVITSTTFAVDWIIGPVAIDRRVPELRRGRWRRRCLSQIPREGNQ